VVKGVLQARAGCQVVQPVSASEAAPQAVCISSLQQHQQESAAVFHAAAHRHE
jgi:hypothetical protein